MCSADTEPRNKLQAHQDPKVQVFPPQQSTLSRACLLQLLLSLVRSADTSCSNFPLPISLFVVLEDTWHHGVTFHCSANTRKNLQSPGDFHTCPRGVLHSMHICFPASLCMFLCPACGIPSFWRRMWRSPHSHSLPIKITPGRLVW